MVRVAAKPCAQASLRLRHEAPPPKALEAPAIE